MQALFIVFLVPILSTIYLATAGAEWDAALYGGLADTTSYTLTQTSPGSTVIGEVSPNTGRAVGGRAGYWFDAPPRLQGFQYGLGLDVFYFTAKYKTQMVPGTVNGAPATLTAGSTSNHTVGLGFDVLRLRYPLLKTEQFPGGRLQPCLTAGPAVFFSRSKDRDPMNGFNPTKQSQSDTSLGVKVSLGVNYEITSNLGLLIEYRFTHFTANYSGYHDTTLGSPITLRHDMDTHYVIVGLSFNTK